MPSTLGQAVVDHRRVLTSGLRLTLKWWPIYDSALRRPVFIKFNDISNGDEPQVGTLE